MTDIKRDCAEKVQLSMFAKRGGSSRRRDRPPQRKQAGTMLDAPPSNAVETPRPANAPLKEAPKAAVGVFHRLRENRAWFIAAAVIACVFGIGIIAWQIFKPASLAAGFVSSNGRVEAEQVDISTKLPGRIKTVLVKEGDTIAIGQVLARMDTAELEAQIREAEAAVAQTRQQLDQSVALVAQRQSELILANQQLDRSMTLVGKGFATREEVDQRQSAKNTTVAALNSASSQIAVSKAMIEAAVAKTDSLKTNLTDSTLVAPRAGRIQYRLALPGEVLPAGGKVLTLLDLGDVYMTVFLPTKEAGRLSMGSEARIVLDAVPQYVIPANISFIAADAQFTPKYVETQTEREKLMFRVKAQIPREVLERYAALVKTGVPGIAYVRVAQGAAWPDKLAIALPK